ncbi:MAG: EAL domain-containing protein [Betaproteobacteria bacterium]
MSRLVEPHFLFPGIALLLLGVVWGTTVSLIMIERASADRAAASSTREIANTYESNILRALREIDQTLKLVKFIHQRSGGRVDLEELKTKGLLLPDLLFVVSVADRNGNVIASTRRTGVTTVANEPHFLAQMTTDAVSMSRPQFGADREWKLHFSRRLSTADGAFAGAALVSVPAVYFVSGYDRPRMGANGVLGMLGDDGIMRARRTGDSIYFGEATDLKVAAFPGGPPTPAATENSWDNVRRYTSVRELFEFPVMVVVGLSEDEQMAAVRARSETYLWRASIGSAGLLALLAGLWFLSRQLSRTRKHASRVLTAIESSVNAILITDLGKPGRPIEYANPAFEKITGYSCAEALGRNTRFLLRDDVDQPALQEIELAIRDKRDGHAVLRNYRKDGSLFWNELYIAPVRNERGDVTHFVEVMNDVTEAKNYESQLAHQANFDMLTGLANRNLLQDRLRQAIINARRDGGTVATVFLDVDNFKVVNDSLGHRIGDEFLQMIAARLVGCVRETDTVGRLGGDEFVLLLHAREDDPQRLDGAFTAILDKVLAAIAEPMLLAERSLRPTCSIGISLFPQDGDDPDTLLRNADAAMYRAKDLGRNRFQFFTADVHERIQRRLVLHSSLRLALEREEFVLHYQPQVCLRTGHIVGIEALVRWYQPGKGLVPPAEFIGFAEETGLIIPIGNWVLLEACKQNKAWQDAGLPKVPIAVNMSAKQCEQEDVDLVVRDVLAASGLDAIYLDLEITESISMANPEQSVPLMEKLKQTGATLSIDDFGTGFSNLSYLRRFPVDRLKIDLSFVRDIASDASSLAITEAIITMAHSLHLQVIAEGVETQVQVDLLRARQCDWIQGNFFSPAVTGKAVARMLADRRRLAGPSVGDAHGLRVVTM